MNPWPSVQKVWRSMTESSLTITTSTIIANYHHQQGRGCAVVPSPPPQMVRFFACISFVLILTTCICQAPFLYTGHENTPSMGALLCSTLFFTYWYENHPHWVCSHVRRPSKHGNIPNVSVFLCSALFHENTPISSVCSSTKTPTMGALAFFTWQLHVWHKNHSF